MGIFFYKSYILFLLLNVFLFKCLNLFQNIFISQMINVFIISIDIFYLTKLSFYKFYLTKLASLFIVNFI